MFISLLSRGRLIAPVRRRGPSGLVSYELRPGLMPMSANAGAVPPRRDYPVDPVLKRVLTVSMPTPAWLQQRLTSRRDHSCVETCLMKAPSKSRVFDLQAPIHDGGTTSVRDDVDGFG